MLMVTRWYNINPPLIKKDTPSQTLLQQRLKLPPGFSISVFWDDLPGARMLRITPNGDLLVSLPDQGKIVLLQHDKNGNGLPDGIWDIVTNLNLPHGLDLYNDWLYVAETDAIGRIRFDYNTRLTSGSYERLITDIPGGGNHWSRTLRFGPDFLMYVSVGSSCNVCEETNPLRAAILRYKPNGDGQEIFATGLRNTVGFAWRPGTKTLYGVDNGRDFLGDDFPPCELNRIKLGKFYGWPYANGNNIPDPDFGNGHKQIIQSSVTPVHQFAAHSAPLGITFLRGLELPEQYRGAALVALHGSWNRSSRIGYEIVSLHFDALGTISQRPFIQGFEMDEDVIGRPVDIAEAPDGSIYISDDFTGTVYRVIYNKKPML